jgi:hypothetical protein
MHVYKTSVVPGNFIVNNKVSTLGVIDNLAGLMSRDLNKVIFRDITLQPNEYFFLSNEGSSLFFE